MNRTIKRMLTAVGVLAAAGSTVLACGSAGATVSPGIDVAAMPAYAGYWDTQWSTMLASTGGLPHVVIVNDNNGDSAIDSNWESLISSLHAKGIVVLGYVHTDYSTRSGTAVNGSVDNYFPSGSTPGSTAPDGILLDQFGSFSGGPMTCTASSYYNTIAGHIYSDLGSLASATIWANPGVPVRGCYLNMANTIDTFVTFEGSYATYSGTTPYNVYNGVTYTDGSAPGYAAWRFAHVLYDTPSTSVHAAIDEADNNFAGHVFMTDDTGAGGANPWDTFPSNTYLNDAVTYAATK